MIPARYEMILFQFLISAVMSCLVSGMVSVINLGVDGFQFLLWFEAWIIAWSIAFPTIVVMSPAIRTLTKSLIKTT